MVPEPPPIGVYLRIECEQRQAERLLCALDELQQATRREAGNLRFDILQSSNQPGTFLLIEEFVNEAAIASHRTSSHFRRFKEATASLARVADRYTLVSKAGPAEN